ncbi:hypothetical protein C9J22_07605, partial [Photobacterium phosphoreum]|uniref:hypothetical protein n=1 Tax=Photobacterium phosphoreum TaxID=659 RepID=UPI000D4EEDBA
TNINGIYNYIYLKKCVIDGFIRLNNYDVLDLHFKFIKSEFLNKKIGVKNNHLSFKEKVVLLVIKFIPFIIIKLLLKLKK